MFFFGWIFIIWRFVFIKMMLYKIFRFKKKIAKYLLKYLKKRHGIVKYWFYLFLQILRLVLRQVFRDLLKLVTNYNYMKKLFFLKHTEKDEYLSMKEGSLFCFVAMRSTEPGCFRSCSWFHDVWTCGAKVLEYWMIFSMKIRINHSWKLQKIW